MVCRKDRGRKRHVLMVASTRARLLALSACVVVERQTVQLIAFVGHKQVHDTAAA